MLFEPLTTGQHQTSGQGYSPAAVESKENKYWIQWAFIRHNKQEKGIFPYEYIDKIDNHAIEAAVSYLGFTARFIDECFHEHRK